MHSFFAGRSAIPVLTWWLILQDARSSGRLEFVEFHDHPSNREFPGSHYAPSTLSRIAVVVDYTYRRVRKALGD